MTKVGFQDVWRAGSRFYYKRTGTDEPYSDMGVITTIAPNFTVDKVELVDPDGGANLTIDEAVREYTESYTLTTANMNLKNWSILMLGGSPATYTQAATETTLTHRAIPGELLKVLDSAGDPVFGLTSIVGIYTGTLGTPLTITDIVASTGVVTLDDATSVSPDDVFMIGSTGLSDTANAGTYKVESKNSNDLTLYAESRARLSSDETTITGSYVPANGGTIYEYGVDWQVHDLDRGFAQIISGGAIAAAADVSVRYLPKAISGTRLVTPQASDTVRGEGMIVFSSDKFARQMVRTIPSLSISPNALTLDSQDYSNMAFDVTVLTDPNDPGSVGKLIAWEGALVDQS